MDITTLLPVFIRIPATPFLMGTPERDLSLLARRYGGTRESYREESPQHTVTLPAFGLARVPITNALYSAYVSATGAPPPLRWRGPQPPQALRDHPVVDVNWNEAHAFCAWLTEQITDSGIPVADPFTQDIQILKPPPPLRLPGEAEWEHAARGTDGRMFPWGDEFDPACANTREAGQSTTPVGHFPAGASPYGLLDMAGNVWEWTTTLDKLYPYDANDGREQVSAPGRRILRGGCYANPQGFARCACRFRLPPTVRNEFIGFRLAF